MLQSRLGSSVTIFLRSECTKTRFESGLQCHRPRLGSLQRSPGPYLDLGRGTHPHNGPLSGTTRVSRYQKGKTNLHFTEARDSQWQWHQLGRMQVCTSLQTDNHASTPPLSVLQGGCPSCRPTNSVKALKAKGSREGKQTRKGEETWKIKETMENEGKGIEKDRGRSPTSCFYNLSNVPPGHPDTCPQNNHRIQSAGCLVWAGVYTVDDV